MGIYIPWLADAARMTGYPVVEVANWRNRGHGGFRVVEGVVGHHTATSRHARGDYPSLGVVTNGHSSLAGPLCNQGLGRSGTIYVVAAGVAWHAGPSNWAGFYDLNDEFVGIEAENDGIGEPWTPAQMDAYPRLVAANLYYMKRAASRYGGHKDVATPRGRKIDPTGIDTTWMQQKVAAYLANPATIHRGGNPPSGGGTTSHTVRAGESLSIIGRNAGVPWQQIANLNGIQPPYTIRAGQVLKIPAGGSAVMPPGNPGKFTWNLLAGHYYGNIAGPSNSHGGYNVSEQDEVRNIQQWLIYRGCVSGVPSSQWASSGWADGRWEGATDTAMITFHNRHYPNQPHPAQCWSDDYNMLARA